MIRVSAAEGNVPNDANSAGICDPYFLYKLFDTERFKTFSRNSTLKLY